MSCNVCMCVCVYVCMYVCMNVWMYVCMYVRMYVCTYVRMYIRTYVCLCVCLYVCMYACMHECMNAWMHECMNVWMYECMYVCMYLHIEVHDGHGFAWNWVFTMNSKLLSEENDLQMLILAEKQYARIIGLLILVLLLKTEVLHGWESQFVSGYTIYLYIYTGWWWTYPSEKYESQLGLLFPTYGKIKNVPNHQPDIYIQCKKKNLYD